MISINSQVIENIIGDNKDEIDLIIINKKTAVQAFLNTPTRIVNRQPQPLALSNNQIAYLNLLINDFENIVKANKANINTFKTAFDNLINGEQMSSNNNTLFRNELIKRMGYSDLRDNFYPIYFEKVGIKACVYCNSQLALTVRHANGSRCAKFQVDHHLPKSEYPCFSISFYNLYPVCGPCNNSKSASSVDFNLYSEDYKDFKKSKFKFILDKKSLLKYRVNGNDADLIIHFDDHGSNLKNTFAIEGIYATQKDIAEELIIKSMIYNKAYRESLRNALVKLYNKKTPMFERLLVGNYIKESDIHKRPMSKFTQDIARQLLLI